METWFIKGFSRLFDFYKRLYGITVLFLVFMCVCGLRFCADGLEVLNCCTVYSVCVLYSCGVMFINVYENGVYKKELINVNTKIKEMQRFELEMYFLSEGLFHRLKALPEDYVFDMMLNVGIGNWFNILVDVLRDTEVKYRWGD